MLQPSPSPFWQMETTLSTDVRVMRLATILIAFVQLLLQGPQSHSTSLLLVLSLRQLLLQHCRIILQLLCLGFLLLCTCTKYSPVMQSKWSEVLFRCQRDT